MHTYLIENTSSSFPYLLETPHLSEYTYIGIVNRKHTIALCTAILKEYMEYV